MKKLLALLLALTLVLSITPVFAEGEVTDGETEAPTYASLAEKYAAEVGNLTRIQTGWTVSKGVISPASGNSMSTYTSGTTRGAFQILKIDLPKPANGQKLDKMIVRFVHSAGLSNFVALKVEDIDVPNVSSIADTAYYAAITKTQNHSTYKAFESYESESKGAVNFFYVDITKYAHDSYLAGKDYIYLAVGAWNTTTNMYLTTCSDGDYVRAGYPPHYYYSMKEVSAVAPVENTADAMKALGNETLIAKENGFKSAGGVISASSGNWNSSKINDGNFGIVKIPLPELPNGKTIGNIVFRYGVGSTQSSHRVFKMPGEDWTTGDYKNTDWYAKVKALNTSYKANDQNIVVAIGDNNMEAYRVVYSDITSYVKECYALGQEYCWIAYGCPDSTCNVGSTTTSDSTYTKAGARPRIYYTIEDTGALALESSAPEKDAIAKDLTAAYKFNNLVIKSATAKVNDVEVPCTIVGNTVSFDLGTAGKKTVTVTATDNARNTITTDAVTFRAGYESHKITEVDGNTYTISNTGAVRSTYNPEVNSGKSSIIPVVLPTLEEGKTLGEFKLRFLMVGGYDSSYFRLFKIPVDPDKVAITDLIQTSGETPEGKFNIYEYMQGAAGEYKADFGNFENGVYNTGYVDVNAGYADLTKYALECIERGQTKMYVAFTSRYSNSLIGIGDSSHRNNNRYHYSYWTVKDAAEVALSPKFVASTDANAYAGATALTELAKGGEYKFATKLSNFTDDAKTFVLYFAQYDEDGCLVALSETPVEVEAGASNVEAASAEIKLENVAGSAKAFVWIDADDYPIILDPVIATVK